MKLLNDIFYFNDREGLAYRHGDRDYRLTHIARNVVRELLA